MKKIYVMILILGITLAVSGCINGSGKENEGGWAKTGTVEKVFITSDAISKNLIGENNVRTVQVYLPPDYNNLTDKRYPVVYFLAGLGDSADVWFNGNEYMDISVNKIMDRMISTGNSKEIIFVVISGDNKTIGSFYANSPITGNWEDFVAKEVVTAIDNKYRTIKSKNSRGIAGHSMGGYGALNIGMKYPETYACACGLSPGIFDQNGLKDFLFGNDVEKNKLINLKNSYNAMSAGSYSTTRSGWLNSMTWDNLKEIYGFAFAGNPEERTFIDIPYYAENGSIKENENLLKWENGYGNVKGKIADYKLKNQQLKAIAVDVGELDEYPWIVRGCNYFNAETSNADIAIKYTKFTGGHQDKIKERFENIAVPFFNENLEF